MVIRNAEMPKIIYNSIQKITLKLISQQQK